MIQFIQLSPAFLFHNTTHLDDIRTHVATVLNNNWLTDPLIINALSVYQHGLLYLPLATSYAKLFLMIVCKDLETNQYVTSILWRDWNSYGKTITAKTLLLLCIPLSVEAECVLECLPIIYFHYNTGWSEWMTSQKDKCLFDSVKVKVVI